ncbi:MAG: hypothetical protein IKP14_12235 [Clostridiales bacterium]|nr:hypothetical protein [Clostridiales bacterium]
MACFLVPVAEAVVTTVISKTLKNKENNDGTLTVAGKIKWLNNMLWGGSALLAFEHLWHGEIVPWFPFLTAAGSPDDMAEVLHEMATVGVTMALLVTFIWIGMVIVTASIERRAINTVTDTEGGKA